MLARFITAAVLLTLLAMLAYVPSWAVVLIAEVVCFVAVFEWTKIAKMNEIQQGATAIIFLLLTIFSVIEFIGIFKSMGVFGIWRIFPFLSTENIITIQKTLIILSSVFWLTFVPYALHKKLKINIGFSAYFVGAFLHASALLSLIFLINKSMSNLLIALLIPIIADVFAFLVGKYFGRTQFTIISPKKTIEGLIAGMTAVVIIGSFLLIRYHGFNIITAIFISLLVGVVSVFGDLFISLGKRWAGIKDSGNILPGHGGILDRIDSYLAALPVFASLIIIFR